MATSCKPTPDQLEEHARIVVALGRPRAVADLVSKSVGQDIPVRNVHRWRQNGIPWKYRPIIVELAAVRGIAIPAGFLTVGGAK